MKKKRRGGMSPEEWAEREARSKETERMLRERIAYHERKVAEEKEARERAEPRRRRFLFFR